MADGDILEMEDDDINFVNNGDNALDQKFDEAIGHIEDIIMGDDFQHLQNNFLEKYYSEFEDTEENKFSYTDIHQEYSDLIEKFLTDELTRRIRDFNMELFQQELLLRKTELDSEIFDILLSFTDFIIFKEMMVDYRMHKEGKAIDLSMCITTFREGSTSSPPLSGNHLLNNPLPLHTSSDEEEDDPNLDLLVIGTSITPRP